MDFPFPSNVGTLKRVAGTDPAANTEVTDAVPTGKWWVLLSVSVQLVQGATQTPTPTLIVDDGTNILFQVPGCSAALTAGTTAQFTWAPGLPLSAGAAGAVQTAPIPHGLVLSAGWRLRTVTAGIGANTNYGVPSYFVCELGS